MNDEELLARFENQSILNHDFSHEKHIRMAYLYLSRNSFEQGLGLIIDGIKKLNTVNEVPVELRTRGFHQTITVGWAKLVQQRLKNKVFASSLDFIEQHPEILNPRLLSEYYTSERLMSWDAKREFIEPDLKTFI